MNRPSHWSHSTLTLWQQCPHAFALKCAGEPQVVAENVREGSDLHEAIARYATICWERGRVTVPEVVDDIGAGYPQSVWHALSRFADEMRWPWRGEKPEGPAPVEQRLEADLPNGERFVGVLDLVVTEANDNPFAAGDTGTVVRVIDWKKSRPAAWSETAVPMQLLTYAWLYQQQHPEALDFELCYSAPGWSGNWAMRKWTAEGSMGYVGQQLSALVDRVIADERCDPTPGAACMGCFYIHGCRVARTVSVQSLTAIGPRDLILYSWLLDAKRKECLRLAKQVEQRDGPINIDGRLQWQAWPRYGYRVRPGHDDDARAVAARVGVEWTSLLGGLQKPAVAKALAEHPELENVIELVETGREYDARLPGDETEPGNGQGGETSD